MPDLPDCSAAAESRYARAAGWYLKFRETRGSELSIEDLQAWDEWFSHAENRAALESLRRVSSEVGRLPRALWDGPLPGRRGDSVAPPRGHGLPQEYDGSISVEEWNALKASAPAARRTLRVRIGWVIGGLAMAAALALVAIGLGPLRVSHGSRPGESLRTSSAERRDVWLSDGSRVTLGASTELSATFTPGRRVIMLERGEALFTVAHDRLRPFVVVAGTGTVTAVGTEFNIRRNLDRVTVTVAEGTVDVAPTEGGNAPAAVQEKQWFAVRLTPGQQVSYDGHHKRTAVDRAGAGAIGWIAGRLQYRDVPLKYVVADMNRFRDTPIVLADSTAGEFEFTGTVFQGKVDDWVSSLEQIFPVKVTRGPDAGIAIHTLSGSEPTNPATAH